MEEDQIITLRVIRKVFVFSIPTLTGEQIKQMEILLNRVSNDYPCFDGCSDDQFTNFDEQIAYELCISFVDLVYRELSIIMTILNIQHEFSVSD